MTEIGADCPTVSPTVPRPDLESGERVGIYGGSFDPIHVGHIDPVLAALDAAELTRVLFLPTAFPPHKRDVEQAPVDVRLAMVELALQEHPALQVLADEVVDEAVYTVDTLTRLSAEYPDCQFFLLIGADSYHHLTRWHRWQDIVAGWDIVVLPRPGWPVTHEPAGSAAGDTTGRLPGSSFPESGAVEAVLSLHPDRSHVLLEEPLVDVSSTEIRRLIQDDEPVPVEWVPMPVLSFLHERGIYRTSSHRAPQTDDLEILPESVTITTAVEKNDLPVADKPAGTSPLPSEVALAARTALDRQAIDLRLLEMGAICGFADYFLICSGNTDRQVGAIADAIRRALRKAGEKPLHVEGERHCTWVLMDYGHLIVHVFDPPTRDFYRLERLWGDAPRVPHQLFGMAKKGTPEAEAPETNIPETSTAEAGTDSASTSETGTTEAGQ